MSKCRENLLWMHTRRAVNDALVPSPYAGPWKVPRPDALDLRNTIRGGMWSGEVFRYLDEIQQVFR